MIIGAWGVSRWCTMTDSGVRAVDPSTGATDDITGANAIPTDETITFVPFNGLLIMMFGGGQTPVMAWTQSGSIFPLIQNPFPNNFNAAFGRVWLNSLWIPDPEYPGAPA